MAASDDPINLIAIVDHADADLVPFFLDHYRRLGVGGFVLALHGAWDQSALDRLDRQADVHIWEVTAGERDDGQRLSVLNSIALSFRDQWLLQVEVDEFLDLPCPTLARTVRTLEILGLDCLPALLVQRQTADGSLPVLDPERDLPAQFPCYNLHLCEEMGLERPAWKTKFPLVRVTAGFRMQRGNHLPPNGRSIDHAPIRGVIHRFKWRAAARTILTSPDGADANCRATRACRRWLADHDDRLPTRGARPCSRDDLVRRGFLVAPDRQARLIAALYRKLAKAAGAEGPTRERLRRQLARLDRPYRRAPRSDRERSLVDPANLLLPPGRICLLTFELAPPQSGGIGTAMTVLAERLSAVGHEVDVVLCPFSGPATLWQGWHDHWAARNVRLHYLPRRIEPDGAYTEQIAFCQTVCETVERLQPDLVHCADAAGYAAFVALLKAAGLALPATRVMVTAHGSTVWHNRGNLLQWYPDEAAQGFCHDVMMRLADVVCFPSDYMRTVVAAADLGVRTGIVVPNGMAGATRSFGRSSDAVRPVDELVLFGRIEPRKGFDRFEKAINALLDRGHRDFKVTLLGKFGDRTDPDVTRALLSETRIVSRVIGDFNHVDAVNYLKGRNGLAVVASHRDNLPYTVYECLENRIPLVASAVGGIPDMIHPDDRARVLVADDHPALVEALADALTNGVRPARLAFEPSLADIELLAIHARLVDEARNDRARRGSKATERAPDIAALVYGETGSPVTAALARCLAEAAVDRRVRTVHLPARLAEELPGVGPSDAISWIEASAAEAWPEEVERTIGGIDSRCLLFCHSAVLPDPCAFQAMHRLLRAARLDAVVCGFRAGLVGREGVVTGPLPALGGPREYAPCRNLFGAGLFLITRTAFDRLGGFDQDAGLDALAHWALLNRLIATGGKVAGIPKPLATLWIDRPGDFVALMNDRLAETLVRPWLDAASPLAEGMIRKAIAADFGRCPTMRTIREELKGP